MSIPPGSVGTLKCGDLAKAFPATFRDARQTSHALPPGLHDDRVCDRFGAGNRRVCRRRSSSTRNLSVSSHLGTNGDTAAMAKAIAAALREIKSGE